MKTPEIIFEDNHLLAVIKPPGYLAQSDGLDRPDILTWGKEYLKTKYHKPGAVYLGLVHRLDWAVGGVMILAKTSKAAARLSQQFRNRELKKTYLAVLEKNPLGLLAPGLLEHRLIREGRLTRLAENNENGTVARLAWRLKAENQKLALVEIDLITGFKHQIRAQMALGLESPVAGDRLYKAQLPPLKSGAIGLWARELLISHPTLKTPLKFTAEPAMEIAPWSSLANLGG